jgi:hypothetical protein
MGIFHFKKKNYVENDYENVDRQKKRATGEKKTTQT